MCGILGFVGEDTGDFESFIHHLCCVNNRGQEAVGLAARYLGGNKLLDHRHWGMVREACTQDRRTFRNFSNQVVGLGARDFVGHTRYPTVGSLDTELIQPLSAYHPKFGQFVIAHNGQLYNHQSLRTACETGGHRFHTEGDSEIIAAMIARSPADNLVDAVQEFTRNVAGTFSFLAFDQKHLVGARDRFGIRPLWCDEKTIGSETAALAGKNTICVQPGEVVWFDLDERNFHVKGVVESDLHHCIFETFYFSRPDQTIGDFSMSSLRQALGERAAQLSSVEADITCYVPDSGLDAGLGSAIESGITFTPRALVRNFYSVSGRSFILAGQTNRIAAARSKFTANPRVIRGKRVIVVDDTVVRLNTMTVVVGMFKDAGAKEVHVQIAAPPVKYPCFHGINIPTSDELPAASHTIPQLSKMVGATTLQYLPIADTLDVVNRFSQGWCTACLSGECPFKKNGL